MNISNELTILLSLAVSLFIVLISIPSIVTVAQIKRLYDEPGRRKSHHHAIPNLGGVAIFAGTMVALGIFADFASALEFKMLIVSMVVIFFIGIKDDILIIDPDKKLIGEIVATLIIVVLGNIRFTSLHGFLGIHEIPYIVSVLLTSFVFIVIINSFNLIDGIDGLASSIGIILSVFFGVWFYLIGNINYAVLSASIAGAFIAFFRFNVYGQKNKVFMGDTGSLLLGLFMSLIVVKFNEINAYYQGPYSISAAPAVSFGILIVPLFDTLRVFLIRILRKQSPFRPDKNHMHHLLLKIGYSHLGATTLMVGVNIAFIAIMIFFQSLGIIKLMLINLAIASALSFLPEFFRRKNKVRQLVPEVNSQAHARPA
ncbi:MAG TPA: MraY family glycosyltransferase [Bacteroidales bacterium]|nr:MraY family glycosyltransferase [Bacteroidales bacterium]